MKATVSSVSRVTGMIAALGMAFASFSADAWDDNHRYGNGNTGAQFGLGFSQSNNGNVTAGGYFSDGRSRVAGRFDGRGRDRDGRWNRRDRGHNDHWRHDGRRDGYNRYGGFNGIVVWQSGPARPSWYRSPFYRYRAPSYVYYNSPRVIAWAVLPAFVYDRLTVRSRGYHEQAYWRAMSAPIGQPIEWNDGINRGQIATTRDGYAGTRYCREFQQTITIGGQRQEAYGTACQEPDGSWRLVASE